MERFNKIFEYLLQVEGGYSNDRYDSGGQTTFGIIEIEARQYGYKGRMQNMPLEIARNIYNKKYYHGNRLDEIKDDRIALSICDWSFNSGKWATKKAQVTLNRYFGYNLVVDGILGSKTIKALNEVEEQGKSEEFFE